MKFSLRHILGFVAIICLALALTQVSPVFALATLIIGLGVAYYLLDTTIWKFFFCCILLGIGIYTIAFVTTAEFLAPPETAAGFKGISEHWTWIWETKPVQHHTAIPIGALVGYLFATAFIKIQELRGKTIPSIHRFVMYFSVAISMFGIVTSVDYAIKHSYTFGKLLVFEFEGEILSNYPPNPERMFEIHLNENYFAISIPMLICGCLLVAGLIGYTIFRQKQALTEARENQEGNFTSRTEDRAR